MKFFLKMDVYVKGVINIIYYFIQAIKNRIRFFSVNLYFKNFLKKKIKSKNKKILIIFDDKTNNPTYGDFLFFIYLARFFVLKNFEVHFFFFNDSNKNWNKLLNFDEIKKFKNEQINLVKKIGKIKSKNIHLTTFEKFKNNNYVNSNIIFEKQVIARIQIFDMILDLLNIILSYENSEFLNKFLLNKKQFRTPLLISKLKPFISWHIRYNEKWGTYNNSANELKFIFKKLRSSFRNKKIAIISDKSGCDFAKKYLNDTKNVVFSKDITNNFYEDIILSLNSNYYFQFKAGGFLFVSVFSSLPYRVIDYPSPNFLPWSKKKYFSWILNNQHRIYRNISKINLISKMISNDAKNYN
jgi:hypothetical protein